MCMYIYIYIHMHMWMWMHACICACACPRRWIHRKPGPAHRLLRRLAHQARAVLEQRHHVAVGAHLGIHVWVIVSAHLGVRLRVRLRVGAHLGVALVVRVAHLEGREVAPVRGRALGVAVAHDLDHRVAAEDDDAVRQQVRGEELALGHEAARVEALRRRSREVHMNTPHTTCLCTCKC